MLDNILHRNFGKCLERIIQVNYALVIQGNIGVGGEFVVEFSAHIVYGDVGECVQIFVSNCVVVVINADSVNMSSVTELLSFGV